MEANDRALYFELGKASGMRSAMWMLTGIVLMSPMVFLAVRFASILLGGEELALQAHDRTPLLVLSAIGLAGIASFVHGFRRRGPRGSKVGRALLDAPEQIHGVNVFKRELKVGGVHARTVNVIAISHVTGEEIELHVQPGNIDGVLQAIKERTGEPVST